MTTQTLSPRQQYQQIRTAMAAKDDLFDFKAPSGMLFKLRAPNMQTFVASGVLPLALAEKMAKAQQQGKNMSEAVDGLSEREQMQLVHFSARLVKYVCVLPRIADDPQSEDEIAPEEMLIEDFHAIVEWASIGGGEAETLNNFPAERQRDAGSGTNGKGLRTAAKRPARHKK